MIIWRLIDGKMGHENQTGGLVEAMACLEPSIQAFDVLCTHTEPWRSRARIALKQGERLPVPDLLLGAGHATHWPLLSLRRRFGGRAVVLMMPSLPLWWFDAVLVPRHDLSWWRRGRRVISTIGVLNRACPGGEGAPDRGLILVGGPSKLHGWDETALLDQLRQLLAGSSTIQWTLTNSRRTPEAFLGKVAAMAPDMLIVPYETTEASWLPAQLREAGHVWVTEDSVSMLFEGLSAGHCVGALRMPCHNARHRVAKELVRLENEGSIRRLTSPQALEYFPTSRKLNETQRCAKLLLECFRETLV